MKAGLARICGKDGVSTDAETLDFFAQDLFEKGIEPAFVVAPKTAVMVGKIVKLAATHKCPLYVRGGGMSYSNTFLPGRKGAIMLDMRALCQIQHISQDDLYVTVQAGCTWAALDQALEPLGLRAKFWGPFSGGTATIGGSLSQGTANNASAQIGTSASCVLGYEIVTGSGDVLNTGKDAQDGHKPFTRNYGPDLTSLFSNDAGALGIKTAATLMLEPRPKAYGGVSFAFENFEAVIAACKAGAASGLASAIIAMDAETAGVRAGKRGLLEDVKKLFQVIRTAHNPWLGLLRGVRIALAGGRVFERAKFTAHFLAEGQTGKLLIAKERALRAAASSHGSELPNVAISMMRLDNFPALPLTHMDGRRMLPIHGILPWSEMQAYRAAYFDLMDGFKDDMKACDMIVADIFSAIDRNSFLCEPVFYWPDSHTEYQRQMSPDFFVEQWAEHPDNPKARALVEQIKSAVIDLQFRRGASHIQIGKQYPFMRGRDGKNLNMLRTLKRELDPDNIINPGALGFKK